MLYHITFSGCPGPRRRHRLFSIRFVGFDMFRDIYECIHKRIFQIISSISFNIYIIIIIIITVTITIYH